ncbi:hypothetical protein L9F63_021623, partial [Diploptera punctata]
KIYMRRGATQKLRPVKVGVRYGPKDGQLLDVFGGQTLPEDAPVLVYVHGGYWQDLSRELSAYCVLPQYECGTRVIVVGYDLAPSVSVNDIIKEIEEAATYIVNEAFTRRSKSVVFCGHSAGAHLISMLLLSGWMDTLDTEVQHMVKGFVLISGVYDLTPLVHTYVNRVLSMNSDDAERCSPQLLQLSPVKTQLEVLIVVGEHESPEFHRQSKQFAQ